MFSMLVSAVSTANPFAPVSCIGAKIKRIAVIASLIINSAIKRIAVIASLIINSADILRARGHNHSDRSAIIGSTFVARRAGIQQARSATTMSNNAITATVSGSVTLTP
jgi:hypothetical protein